MFTGIIRQMGQIKKIDKINENIILTIESFKKLENVQKGDSIAIDGVCTTIIEINDQQEFKVELMPETLRKTSLNNLLVGSKVNLELSLCLKDRIDGHLVLGHIDTIGMILEIKNDGERSKITTIKFPLEISRFLALKGSISINGVSLTISFLNSDNFSVSLIPHTLENTNLGLLKIGDTVNLEIDIIARYLAGMLQENDKQTKYQWLQERNFI